MSFPEVIILSQGMLKEIDVSFRPVTYENYNDTIYFRLVEDNPNIKSIGFHVPVRAVISPLTVRHDAGLALAYIGPSDGPGSQAHEKLGQR